MDTQQFVEKVAEAMFAQDPAVREMGITLESIAPGTATMKMPVRDDMINGHELCHGGYVFSLADSAFAYACNSYNYNTVGAAASIDYIAPGRLGDELIAVAKEVNVSGRSGVYDVQVWNQNGDLLAVFRGNSRRIKGLLDPELGEWAG